MPKRGKCQRTVVANSSSNGNVPQTSNKPRLDPRKRQLSRFYEPLVLLYTLGDTRGDHPSARSTDNPITPHLSREDTKRKLLNELAYCCDYDKGGDTVTAIGLEEKPDKYVYWVAANASLKEKVLKFLESLLTELRVVSNKPDGAEAEDVEKLVVRLIEVATPRIKKYWSHLKPLLRTCHEHLHQREELEQTSALGEWLREMEKMHKNPITLCQFAYSNRKSSFMDQLSTFGMEREYITGRGSVQSAFRLTRHYIGRLGHHIRAAKTLVSGARRLSEIFDNFEVRGIPTPAKQESPRQVDNKTRLDSIMVRMLPANSPDLDDYQLKLAEMDMKHQLSSRFMENYENPNFKPRVHAEVQVLEHFYQKNLSFAGNDRFIACSKPACYCCQLYFRHHPGRFVEPESHRKIHLNWGFPESNATDDALGKSKVQTDILNSMTKDIRKDALEQIKRKAPSKRWHPDSLTGISISIYLETKAEKTVWEVREEEVLSELESDPDEGGGVLL